MKYQTESALVSGYAASLVADGWQVRREVAMSGGRLDLEARRNGDRMLIEAKRSTDFNSISHAVGQLLLYAADEWNGADVDQATLVLLTCRPLGGPIARAVRQLGIDHYSLE